MKEIKRKKKEKKKNDDNLTAIMNGRSPSGLYGSLSAEENCTGTDAYLEAPMLNWKEALQDGFLC